MSHQSGPFNKNPHLLISGNVEKQNLGIDKLKRLSFLGRKMGGFNDDHNQLHSTNITSDSTSLKFKLPIKIFSDSSTSVPRKLRSAIRKRSCESGSVPLLDAKRSKNKGNGVESLERNSFKNSEQNGWSDHSARKTATLAISKDEEEVAETLFALAGMIPRDALHDNKKTKNELFEEKSSDLKKKQHNNSTPSFDDNVTRNEEQETTINSPNKLSERRQINLNLQVSIPPAPFQIPPLLRACDSSEQNTQRMLNGVKPEKNHLHRRESHINLGVPGDLLPASENINNALTSKLLPDCGVDGLSTRPSVTRSWLDNTSSPISGSFKDAPLASKVSCFISGGRKSWKRCIAHVCISHLIQGLQNSEGKDIPSIKPDQIRPSQSSAAEDKDNLTKTLAPGHMFGPGAPKTGNCTEEGSSFSGCYDSNKQSYNFLSLSTGMGTEVNNGVNRMGVTLEAKGNVLQLHSVGQHNTFLPQNHFPSIPYRDQAAVISGASPSMAPQVNLQLPPYFGNPCGPAHIRSTQHPPSKQQQIWTAQLAAQLRPGPFLSTHIPNWKNSQTTREMQSLSQSQPPRPSQETMGAKFLQISQQPQQQLFGLCQSLPSISTTKLQNGQQPSICEDKGGRFHPDGVLPLQLLCNERLLS